MEELNFYPDSCTIDRYTSVTAFTQVYSGSCSLQRPNSGSAYLAGGFQYQSSPTLMLPLADVNLAVNDKVTVTVANGRVLTGTIEDFESVADQDLLGTTVWLKGVL